MARTPRKPKKKPLIEPDADPRNANWLRAPLPAFRPVAMPPTPSQQSAPEAEEITLTPAQGKALDKAWDSITDADIDASMSVFDDDDEAPQPPEP